MFSIKLTEFFWKFDLQETKSIDRPINISLSKSTLCECTLRCTLQIVYQNKSSYCCTKLKYIRMNFIAQTHLWRVVYKDVHSQKKLGPTLVNLSANRISIKVNWVFQEMTVFLVWLPSATDTTYKIANLLVVVV